jgi:hypothetical protein
MMALTATRRGPEVNNRSTETLCVTLADGSEHTLRLPTGKTAGDTMYELIMDEVATEMSKKWLACESGTYVRRSAIISVRVVGSNGAL